MLSFTEGCLTLKVSFNKLSLFFNFQSCSTICSIKNYVRVLVSCFCHCNCCFVEKVKSTPSFKVWWLHISNLYSYHIKRYWVKPIDGIYLYFFHTDEYTEFRYLTTYFTFQTKDVFFLTHSFLSEKNVKIWIILYILNIKGRARNFVDQ